jgi:hypothetical protein
LALPAVIPPAGLVFATIRRRAIDLGRSNDRRIRRLSPRRNVRGQLTPRGRPEESHDAGSHVQLPDTYRDAVTPVWGELTFAEIASARNSCQHSGFTLPLWARRSKLTGICFHTDNEQHGLSRARRPSPPDASTLNARLLAAKPTTKACSIDTPLAETATSRFVWLLEV